MNRKREDFKGSPEHKAFRKRVRIRMIELELTDAQVAERIDYTEKTFGKWMAGERIPPLRAVLALSKCLGCSLDEMFA